MKKLALLSGLLVVLFATACTKDQVNQNEEIEILSPEKDKSQCTAC